MGQVGAKLCRTAALQDQVWTLMFYNYFYFYFSVGEKVWNIFCHFFINKCDYLSQSRSRISLSSILLKMWETWSQTLWIFPESCKFQTEMQMFPPLDRSSSFPWVMTRHMAEYIQSRVECKHTSPSIGSMA